MNHSRHLQPARAGRRAVLRTAGALALAVPLGTTAWAQSAAGTMRVGFQKGGGLLNVLKAQGRLEKLLGGSGWKVSWHEFPAGPQLLEALNGGSVDLGWTGAPPPIFAQAAGIELVYAAAEPPAPHIEAIVVRPDSPVRTVADLRGKRVAFQKGSSANFLLVAALEKAGVKFSEIQPVHLPPADGRAAFESGRVDVWSVWDPYLAAVQDALKTRTLSDYEGLLQPSTFYQASRRFAENHPQVLEELARTGEWANGHRRELAELLAPTVGLPVPVVEAWQARNPYGAQPITPQIVAVQQQVADTFHAQNLIPRRIEVARYVWDWKRG
ncbi:MAG: putative aliphatic sulfonates-binding protein [Paracidovorax wautersii]|uniref:Putative aliphatic sulfonates-binding protein n=1 Tax=Paracidovorax wautersii TaxID=1177982 RepID=A0A7V8JRL1_9BURK|nr:MAG: putative aliphatic sulfonates-binding protein [Paracidovorax wautersii]